jgi:hypothetical protein
MIRNIRRGWEIGRRRDSFIKKKTLRLYKNSTMTKQETQRPFGVCALWGLCPVL